MISLEIGGENHSDEIIIYLGCSHDKSITLTCILMLAHAPDPQSAPGHILE